MDWNITDAANIYLSDHYGVCHARGVWLSTISSLHQLCRIPFISLILHLMSFIKLLFFFPTQARMAYKQMEGSKIMKVHCYSYRLVFSLAKNRITNSIISSYNQLVAIIMKTNT